MTASRCNSILPDDTQPDRYFPDRRLHSAARHSTPISVSVSRVPDRRAAKSVILACLFLGAAGLALLPVPALSADPATGAPVQLGVPTAPDNSAPATQLPTPPDDYGDRGGISATPLPPPTVQPPGVQQPTVQQPTIQAPTVGGPAAPIPPTMAQPDGTQPDGGQDMSMQGMSMQNTAMSPGLLDDQHQGLGQNLWQGSSIVKLTSLLPKLPAPVTQPSLRDLQLRLLLTQAPGPGAIAGIDSLVPLRAERLHAMGFDTEAMQISKPLSGAGGPTDPQEAVEKLWLAGDNDAACEKVQAQIDASPNPEAYWRRALIFCQVLKGQEDQASIGIDLLREQAASDPRNKDFIAVASILTGDSKPQSLKAPISNPDPLLTAMMKQANLKVDNPAGTAIGKPVGPAAAAATARDGSKPLAERIKAAELAYATGLLLADELTGLYLQVPPAANDAAASDAALAGPDTPEHRGQLYQAAQRGQMPGSRAPLISQALREAMLRGDYFATVSLYAPLVQQITPNPSLAWFAPDAARASFATGNIDRGDFWLNLAQGAMGDPEVAKTVPGLRLLGRIAGLYGGAEAGGDPVADWSGRTGATDAKAQRVYGILAGLGEAIGSHGTATFTGGDPDIAAAAQGGRRGETVLLALIALGGRGLAQADGASLAQSLGGLTAVGLQADARRIAIEAAILSGL